jgi:hypothetical protein
MTTADPTAKATNSTKKKQPPSQKSQIMMGLFISAMTLFLCFGSVELVGYFWERSVSAGDLGWSLVASRRIEFEVHGTNEQPYPKFVPNGSYEWEGIPVAINSKGFRTEEFTTEKADDVYRILNVGDSFVFGWEVEFEDTYGKVWERALNANGKKVEVINAGIPTWNLEAERNFLLQEGLSYQPDLIVLDLTIVNDIKGAGPTPPADSTSIFDWLRDNTYSWSFLRTQMQYLQAGKRGPEAIPVLNPPTQVGKYFSRDPNDPEWAELWAYIEEMATMADEQGIEFVILAFPTAFQLNSEGHPDTPQVVFSGLAENAGIPFIDLLPIYQAECNRVGNDLCEGYVNHLFADVWMHPNALGNQLAAEELGKRIEIGD